MSSNKKDKGMSSLSMSKLFNKLRSKGYSKKEAWKHTGLAKKLSKTAMYSKWKKGNHHIILNYSDNEIKEFKETMDSVEPWEDPEELIEKGELDKEKWDKASNYAQFKTLQNQQFTKSKYHYDETNNAWTTPSGNPPSVSNTKEQAIKIIENASDPYHAKSTLHEGKDGKWYFDFGT